MRTVEEQENLIRKLGNKEKSELQEIIKQIWNMNFFTEEEIFDFTFILGALGIGKLDVALKVYWRLDEDERLNFLELIN